MPTPRGGIRAQAGRPPADGTAVVQPEADDRGAPAAPVRVLADLAASFLDVDPGQLDGALHASLAVVGTALDADRASLCAMDPAGPGVELVTCWHRSAPAGTVPSPLLTHEEAAAIAAAVESVEVIRVDDTERCMPAGFDRGFLETHGVRSMLVVPIAARGRPAGFLGLSTVERARPWSEGDVQAVRSIAGLFGLVLARRSAEARFLASAQRARLAFEDAPIGISISDGAGRILEVNRAMCALTGRAEHELVGRCFTELTHPHDRGETIAAFAQLTTGAVDGYELEKRFALPDGTDHWVRVRARPMSDGRFVALVESIDARRRAEAARQAAEAQLSHQALHDHLTGLPNRALFESHLERAIAGLARSPGAVAVLFLDLDRFKVVNDSAGHVVGDELLQVVARRLRESLRSEDVVARLGGDEFTVLLTGQLTVDDMLGAADRLRRTLTAPVRIDHHEVFTGVSVGVAYTTEPGVAPLELLRRADAALYRAKERGRGRVELFDDELGRRLAGRLHLETALRRGIERGEIEVYYQPEVELRTGRVVGVEALARWRHPEHGVLAAGSFIDLAEETGLIVPIGELVLRQACEQVAAWGRAGHRLTVRCNLSARQLTEPALLATVAAACTGGGLDPRRLCLEITETTLMADPVAGLQMLRGLAGLGVELAIDDFGTGYSSLAYLKRFPLDVLKIDRSFVAGLPGDTDDVAIVTTIVRLAETLGMAITAEGVETEAQRACLLGLGVGRGQGFLFSPPVPPGHLEQLLEAGVQSRA